MIKRKRLLYQGIIILCFCFVLLVIALIGREVWQGSGKKSETEISRLDPEEWEDLKTGSQEDWEKDSGCLYIYENNKQGREALAQMETVLGQMKVSFRAVKAVSFRKQLLKKCDTVAIGVSRLRKLGEGLEDIVDWVRGGGNLLLVYSPTGDGFLGTLAPELGIQSVSLGNEYVETDSLHFVKPFMPGGEDVEIAEPYPGALSVTLSDECELFLESGDEYPVPLIWRKALGKGTVVVVNLGYFSREYRGFYAAAYSLLGEGLAYPVINGSAYLIDDFPGPMPEGSSELIDRDYREMDLGNFIDDIWWEDLRAFAEEYDVRYTGAVIENYNDDVDGTVNRNLNYGRFQRLGNGILKEGGELAYHGYNQHPLALKASGNNLAWESAGAMRKAMEELADFCGEAFSKEEISVYVPPANMLSEKGRRMLTENFPQIRSICGTYLSGEGTLEQEYGVAEDGIVETPWSTQGLLFEDDTKLMTISELSFHYAGEHFLTLDELMDSDEPQSVGWPEMQEQMDGYLDWMYSAAPELRRLTASGMAGAVQRYDAVTVRRTWEKDVLRLELGNTADDVWLMVRLNGREPGEVRGGELTEVLEGLYLLKAESDQVEIGLE